MYENLFERLGLSEKEAKIYETLLKYGETFPSSISSETKLKRSTVYAVLEGLESKNLISKTEKKGKINFKIEHPELLKTYVEKQRNKLREAEQNLDNALPDLVSAFNLTTFRPKVSYIEGIEGFKKIFMSMLEDPSEVIHSYFTEIDEMNRFYKLDSFWNEYQRERLKKQVKVKAIVTDNEEGIEYRKMGIDQLRYVRLVPRDKFKLNLGSFSCEKDIWGDKIAFFSLNKQGILTTLIENKEMANCEKVAFELAWEAARRYDLNITRRLGIN